MGRGKAVTMTDFAAPQKETETKRDGRVLCEEDRRKKEVERKGAASVAQQMMTFLGNVPYR